eukprot:30102-Pelagococcus_subviridis.AAC.16
MIVSDRRNRRCAAASPLRSFASPMTSHVKCGRRKSGTDGGDASDGPERDDTSFASVPNTCCRRSASVCGSAASSAPALRISARMSSFL